LVSWELVYTSQARKDARKLASSGLKPHAERLLAILAKNPYQTPPPFEKLVGDLAGAYSRRINIQHRLVYQILDRIKTVKVIRMWTHYG
jgi:Txe/YoeB family toxin of toxin-antitoxin system